MRKKKNTMKKSRKMKRSYMNRKNKRTYRKMKRKSTKRRYIKRKQRGGKGLKEKLHEWSYRMGSHGKKVMDELAEEKLLKDGELYLDQGDDWYRNLNSDNYPTYRTILRKLDEDPEVPRSDHLETFNSKLKVALDTQKEQTGIWGSGSSPVKSAVDKKTKEKKAEKKEQEELDNALKESHNEESANLDAELEQIQRAQQLKNKQIKVDKSRAKLEEDPEENPEENPEEDPEEKQEEKKPVEEDKEGEKTQGVQGGISNVNTQTTRVEVTGGGKQKRKKKKRSKQKGG